MQKRVQESILAILFSVTYIFLVARFSTLLLMMLPIPFIILGVRNGMKTSIFAMAILFTILNITFNISIATSTLILFMPSAIVIQFMIGKKYNSWKLILIAAGVFFVSLFGTIYFEEQITGINLIEQMDKSFDSMISAQRENLESMEMSKSEVDTAVDLMRTTYNYISTVMPMMLGILSLMVAYINYSMSAHLINRTGKENIQVAEFSKFKLPSNFILGIAVMFLASYGATKMDIPYNGALKQNLIFLVSTLFLIQGLSILDYFLKKIKIHKALRGLLIVMNLILMPIGAILIILGFIDSIIDLRKIKTKG